MKIIKKLAFLLIFFTFLVILPQNTYAYTNVSSCQTISSSGEYRLNQNISVYSTNNCIQITANDVIFDGDGFYIKDDDSSTSDTFLVNANLTNITIRNINFENSSAIESSIVVRYNNSFVNIYNINITNFTRGEGGSGIKFSSPPSTNSSWINFSLISRNISIDNIFITKGSWLPTQVYVDKFNRWATNVTTGIFPHCISIANTENATLTNSNFINCSVNGRGVSLGHNYNSTIENNIVEGNFYGFWGNQNYFNGSSYIDMNIIIRNNTIKNAQYGGAIAEKMKGTIIENNTIEQTGYGIYLYEITVTYIEKNTIIRNNVFKYGLDGGYGSVVIRNCSCGNVNIDNNTFINTTTFSGLLLFRPSTESKHMKNINFTNNIVNVSTWETLNQGLYDWKNATGFHYRIDAGTNNTIENLFSCNNTLNIDDPTKFLANYKRGSGIIYYYNVMSINSTCQIKDVFNCENLSLPNYEYRLLNDITASSGSADCIIISADNITLDCQNYLITGGYLDYHTNFKTIRATSNNNTVRNCRTRYGFIIPSSNSRFYNIFNNVSAWGLYLSGIVNSNFTNITLYDNYWAIRWDSSNNSIFDNVSLIYVSAVPSTEIGIEVLATSTNNTFKNSYMQRKTCFYDAVYGMVNNSFYNNIFNCSTYLSVLVGEPFNKWNITKSFGLRVDGKYGYLGGNYWTNSTNNSFSDTCLDEDVDGICDDRYILDGNNTDYLPLAYLVGDLNATYNLTIATPNETCGVFVPSLGLHGYVYGSEVTITVYPTCNFTYWLANATGINATVYTTSFALTMDRNWNATAFFGYNPYIQNESYGGGIKLPKYKGYYWNVLNFVFSGYFILGLFNIGVAGLTVYYTKDYYLGIGVFLAVFLAFLFGGFYPSIMWSIVIFITSVIVVLIVMKISGGE